MMRLVHDLIIVIPGSYPEFGNACQAETLDMKLCQGALCWVFPEQVLVLLDKTKVWQVPRLLKVWGIFLHVDSSLVIHESPEC